MELNNINNKGNWGSTAASLNDNFAKVNAEVEKVKSSTVRFKGFFTSFAGLSSACPTPGVGDTAWVGNTYPGMVYECKSAGVWANTNKAPITPSVQLADYAKTELLDKRTTEYNVSVQHPSSGIDGTNKFTLSLAIALVPSPLRTVGIKCSFLNDAGTVETWEYQGGAFVTVGSWTQGGARKVAELEVNASSNYLVKVKVITDDSKIGSGITKREADVFFVDTLLTGFDLGTPDNPKYYGAPSINPTKKYITIFEVDKSGKYVNASNSIVTAKEIDVLGNYSVLYGENGTKTITATLIVDWSRITMVEVGVITSIKFDSGVYNEHNGIIYQNNRIEKIESTAAKETNTIKFAKIDRLKEGTNRLNPIKLTNGKYITASGALGVGSISFNTLIFTEWSDHTQCIVGKNGSAAICMYSCAQYDINKVFIPDSYVGASKSNTIHKVDGAVYFQLTYLISSVNQLNWGDTVLPYDEFYDSYIVNKLSDNTPASFKPDLTDKGLLNLIRKTQSTEVINSPIKIYTVCNNNKVLSDTSRNYSSNLYVDHLINLTTKKNIRFNSTGSDKLPLFSPIVDTTMNGGENVLKRTITEKLIGDIIDTDISFQHISVLSNLTKSFFPKVLVIGDSVTGGYLGNLPSNLTVDNPKKYWAFTKKLFELDKIESNGGHNYLSVGTTNEDVFKVNGTTIKAYAEGRGGWNTDYYLFQKEHEGRENVFYNDNATGDVKFSLISYLNKYKTLADDGITRLVVGQTAGTQVTDVMAYDVCTPTYVVLALAFNDVQNKWSSNIQLLIQSIKSEFPEIIIIINLFDAAGSYYPELYPEFTEEINLIRSGLHGKMFNIVSEAKAMENESEKIFLCPNYYVQPTAWGFPFRDSSPAESMVDDRFCLKVGYGSGMTYHPNNYAHAAWGYQLYSLIKYTMTL